MIAGEVSADYAIIEIDAADLTMAQVREFERMCRVKPLGSDGHAFIVNEAHRLSQAVISRLLSTFELPERTRHPARERVSQVHRIHVPKLRRC